MPNLMLLHGLAVHAPPLLGLQSERQVVELFRNDRWHYPWGNAILFAVKGKLDTIPTRKYLTRQGPAVASCFLCVCSLVPVRKNAEASC